ncbi:hypothetical protein [Polyangium mundeleinium]|uniref:Uncharacterized protein n=1 Tax=Polyangium mundeleinium TaxID=2995306 RepID=A0ABT5F2S9_9BACT|nr:hypothetical protein [Polyangium mundeleinium]MDC0747787.1 hypothetical protein [Polyangium mundeleinium]
MPLKVSIATKKEDVQLSGREAETVNALLETRFDMLVMGATVMEEIHGTQIMTTARAREYAKDVHEWARAHFSDLDIEVRFEGEMR